MARIEEIRDDPWHPRFIFFLGCGFAARSVFRGSLCSLLRSVGGEGGQGQSPGFIVHIPLGAFVVPVPTVSVIRWIATWPS